MYVPENGSPSECGRDAREVRSTWSASLAPRAVELRTGQALAPHSLVCRWHWQGAAVGVHAGDERTAPARGGLNGLFEEAVEEHRSGPRPASTEAKGELVEV
jgi:hypothetical protein